MQFKAISGLYLFLLLVLLVAACSTSRSSLPSGEASEAPTSATMPASLDLQPNGCDLVCVLSASLQIQE